MSKPQTPSPEAAARSRRTLRFADSDLPTLRETVHEAAVAAGLDPPRVTDFVLAVHELAANSVVHGGGRGTLRIWVEAETLICEVADKGEFFEKAAGAARRGAQAEGGFGLWIVRQACDSVEIRQVRGHGTVVRVTIAIDASAAAGH